LSQAPVEKAKTAATFGVQDNKQKAPQLPQSCNKALNILELGTYIKIREGCRS
jgi:hypothetical protein